MSPKQVMTMVTEGRVTEALLCRNCQVPGYPCPQILAVGISHHGGGSGSRSPRVRLIGDRARMDPCQPERGLDASCEVMRERHVVRCIGTVNAPIDHLLV